MSYGTQKIVAIVEGLVIFGFIFTFETRLALGRSHARTSCFPSLPASARARRHRFEHSHTHKYNTHIQFVGATQTTSLTHTLTQILYIYNTHAI